MQGWTEEDEWLRRQAALCQPFPPLSEFLPDLPGIKVDSSPPPPKLPKITAYRRWDAEALALVDQIGRFLRRFPGCVFEGLVSFMKFWFVIKNMPTWARWCMAAASYLLMFIVAFGFGR
jgi:hypothetical protein